MARQATQSPAGRGTATEAEVKAAVDNATRIAPTGARIGRAAGPGNINPGAGVRSRQTGKLEYVGEIMGFAVDLLRHPNSKDPTKTSIKFMGRFVVVPAKSSGLPQRVTSEAYFPGIVERSLAAQLDKGESNIPVAIEVWAEPDQISGVTTPTATGYVYAVYDRMPAREDDPMWALAAYTGIGTIPELAPALTALPGMSARRQLAGPAPAAPGEPENFDPQTGELIDNLTEEQTKDRGGPGK